MAGFEYRKTIDGQAPEIQYWTVGAVAIKRGDAVIIGASANLVIPSTAASDKIVGVALNDAAIGATVSIVQATGSTLFAFPCTSTKKYVASADKFTTMDITVFTSGAMTIDPATDASHQIFAYDLDSKGLADNTNGNTVLGIFALRYLDK